MHEVEPKFTVKEANLGGHLAAGDGGETQRKAPASSALAADNQVREAINLLKAQVIFNAQRKSVDSGRSGGD